MDADTWRADQEQAAARDAYNMFEGRGLRSANLQLRPDHWLAKAISFHHQLTGSGLGSVCDHLAGAAPQISWAAAWRPGWRFCLPCGESVLRDRDPVSRRCTACGCTADPYELGVLLIGSMIFAFRMCLPCVPAG